MKYEWKIQYYFNVQHLYIVALICSRNPWCYIPRELQEIIHSYYKEDFYFKGEWEPLMKTITPLYKNPTSENLTLLGENLCYNIPLANEPVVKKCMEETLLFWKDSKKYYCYLYGETPLLNDTKSIVFSTNSFFNYFAYLLYILREKNGLIKVKCPLKLKLMKNGMM